MHSAYCGNTNIPPDGPTLEKNPGELITGYKAILEPTNAFDEQWKYNDAKIDWRLETIWKGKTLFRRTPLVKEHPAAARKYSEGYPLGLAITKKTDMKDVPTVLEVLKELR
jgi:hypothetical protein